MDGGFGCGARAGVAQEEEVAEDFHARFSAVSKAYTYDLCMAPVLPMAPFLLLPKKDRHVRA